MPATSEVSEMMMRDDVKQGDAMIYELINPSDPMTFTGNDDTVAAIAILVFSNGKYGLKRKGNDEVLPIFLFGGGSVWANEKVGDLDAWFAANKRAVGEFLGTCAYGDAADREAYDKAISMMGKKEAEEFREWHQDKNRTSMTNIGKAALSWSKKLLK